MQIEEPFAILPLGEICDDIAITMQRAVQQRNMVRMGAGEMFGGGHRLRVQPILPHVNPRTRRNAKEMESGAVMDEGNRSSYSWCWRCKHTI